MAADKDYYKTLGINKNASAEDIKKAYRKLAREFHPDMVKSEDKKAAEEKFKEINEAYQVLSDPQKKSMYDQYGTAAPGFGGGPGFSGQQGQWGPFTYSYSSSGGQNPFGDFDPFDVFEEFFGFRGFGGRKPRKGKNLRYEMVITFAEAVFGVEKEVNVESGRVKIKIPAGISRGVDLRFPQKGMAGPNGAPAGDLFITVKYNLPKEFNEMGGADLGVIKEISFVDAILGGTIEIPVVDTASKSGIGKAEFKIPAGTQFGTRFVIKGKGMPRVNDSGRGNVYVQVSIKLPDHLSRDQRNLLEEFRKK